jgi:hypothetical protein
VGWPDSQSGCGRSFRRPASRTCWPARSPNLTGGLELFAAGWAGRTRRHCATSLLEIEDRLRQLGHRARRRHIARVGRRRRGLRMRCRHVYGLRAGLAIRSIATAGQFSDHGGRAQRLRACEPFRRRLRRRPFEHPDQLFEHAHQSTSQPREPQPMPAPRPPAATHRSGRPSPAYSTAHG